MATKDTFTKNNRLWNFLFNRASKYNRKTKQNERGTRNKEGFSILALESLESRQLLSATTWTVNSPADFSGADYSTEDNILTFREAILRSSSGDTITFDSSVFTKENNTIKLTSEIVIGHSITVDGAINETIGGASVEVGRVSLVAQASEADPFRVLNISISMEIMPAVTLSGLNIEGGYLTSGNGAGINISGDATLLNFDISDCCVANNSTKTGSGGGISYGNDKGIIISASFQASNLFLLNNSANSGSALSFQGGGTGKGIVLNNLIAAGNISTSGPIVDITCSADSSITDATVAGNVIQSPATNSYSYVKVTTANSAKFKIYNTVIDQNISENAEITPQGLTVDAGAAITYSLLSSCSVWTDTTDLGNNYLAPSGQNTFSTDFSLKKDGEADGEYVFKSWNHSEWIEKLQLAGDSIAVNTGSSLSTKDAAGNVRKQGGSMTVSDWIADRGALEFAGTAPVITVSLNKNTWICDESLSEGTNLGTISITDIDNKDILKVTLPTENDYFQFTETETGSGVWTITAKKAIPTALLPYEFSVSAIDTYGKSDSQTVKISILQKVDLEAELQTSFVYRDKTISEADKQYVLTQLPANSTITEWSQYYLEIWGKFTSQSLTESDSCAISFTATINSGFVSGDSEQQLFVPGSFLAGTLFSDFNVTGLENNTDGTLTISFSGTLTESALGQNILLGKILYTNKEAKGAIKNQGYDTKTEVGASISDCVFKIGVGESSLQQLAASYVNSGNETVSQTLSVRAVIYDSNEDGSVNMSDFINFATNFNSSNKNSDWSMKGICYDYNGDGSVNMTDFIAFATNFNSQASAHSVISYPTALPAATSAASDFISESFDADLAIADLANEPQFAYSACLSSFASLSPTESSASPTDSVEIQAISDVSPLEAISSASLSEETQAVAAVFAAEQPELTPELAIENAPSVLLSIPTDPMETELAIVLSSEKSSQTTQNSIPIPTLEFARRPFYQEFAHQKDRILSEYPPIRDPENLQNQSEEILTGNLDESTSYDPDFLDSRIWPKGSDNNENAASKEESNKNLDFFLQNGQNRLAFPDGI